MAPRSPSAPRLPLLAAAALLTLSACTTSEPTRVAGPAGPADASVGVVNPPIIFLHYDYMVAADHSHQPDPASIQLVVNAFRDNGIALVVDPNPTAIPEAPVVSFGQSSCPGAVSFFDLKGRYFDPKGPLLKHYALFAHDVCASGDTEPGGTTGISELKGNDIVIGMGRLEYRHRTDPGSFVPPFQYWEGGTLMHELGHNLGLTHNGPCPEPCTEGLVVDPDITNRPPNYRSVMNYSYQFGIGSAAQPGSIVAATYRLDFSHGQLPRLDERQLDETQGFGGVGTDILVRSCPDQDGDGLPDAWESAEAGPVDLNCDGEIEPDVSAIIDFGGSISGGSTYRVLEDHDDWTWVYTYVRRPPF